MFRYFLLLLGVLCTSICFAQTTFKPGYFIDLAGNKTECFIKDQDWKNSPASFDYRLTEGGNTEKMNTADINEFKAGDTQYKRASVKYDQSSQELKKAGVTSNPDWTEGNLLLKVLVDGKGSLYYWSTSDHNLFFFNVDGGPIEQLVFRYYLNPADITQLVKNNMYLSQLNSRVRCSDSAPANERDVPYQQRQLTSYFRKYNVCNGAVETKIAKSVKAFSLRLTPGLDFASMNALSDLQNVRQYHYSHETSFRIGVDLQFVLPFNNGKWAIMVEPTYASYSGKDVKQKSTLKQTLFEAPVGVRYRFFLSDKSSIFLNGMALVGLPLTFTQTFPGGGTETDLTLKGAVGFAGGAGFSFGRFSIEGRYYPQRAKVTGFVNYGYTKSTLILGFRLF